MGCCALAGALFPILAWVCILTSIALPTIPEGESLEDYVAASLQCGGFYIDKSLTERGASNVLELDIVAWKAEEEGPHFTLVEVKGGGWGFSDIFKVYGWQKYLEPRNISSAYLVGPTGKRTDRVISYTHKKCEDIGLGLVTYDSLEGLESELVRIGLAQEPRSQIDHGMWRFSFWLERKIQQVVTQHRKQNGTGTGPGEVYAYQELIRSGLLQARDIRERLASLYQAHFQHPALAKAVAAELDGSSWDAKSPKDGKHWQEALYDCKHHLVQASMYYQHRARLGVLKGAVEFALLERQGKLPPERRIRFLDIEVPSDFLPPNFRKTVEYLLSLDKIGKYPAVWQSFMWKWGGFLLCDQEEKEKEILGQELGMETKEVEQALGIYDMLFPMSGGWFTEMQGTKILKLFPGAFRGIGVNLRMRRNGHSKVAETFGGSTHQFMFNNVVSWNNAAVELLTYGERGTGGGT